MLGEMGQLRGALVLGLVVEMLVVETRPHPLQALALFAQPLPNVVALHAAEVSQAYRDHRA